MQWGSGKYIRIIIKALFTTAKNWGKKSHVHHRKMDKSWYSHTMEWYSVKKRNELLIHEPCE